MPNPHRGRWQAQGADIKRKEGYSTVWDQAVALTKAEGLKLLQDLAKPCEAREKELREAACRKAKRFVEKAPPEGYPATGANKPFYVEPRDKRYRGARIDLDMKAGMAFTGPRR